MNYHLIGVNIKKYRSFNGKKQEVLAKEIGVSRIMMSRYENGHVNLSLEILVLIAQRLNISVAELLTS